MHEILLVDDSADDALLLERALRVAGVGNPLRHAGNGADAIAFLNTQEAVMEKKRVSQLGIIFIDLKLPDKSGFDILNLMHGRKAFAETLRVVISSIESMENIKRAYALGADSFISKPVTQFDLAELIRSFPEQWLLVDAASPSGS